SSFIKLPATFGKNLGDFLLQNKKVLTVDPDKYSTTSVFAMKPGSPVITELSKVPVVPEVKTHSIIAVKGEGPVEEGDDGIVKYRSAHLDGVESEFVIRAGHSCQGEPGTIEEVRRILLLHAAQ
ncbi:MAG: alpha/beta hydrolase, partial [Nitrospira sp.]